MTDRLPQVNAIFSQFYMNGTQVPAASGLPGHGPDRYMFDDIVDFIPEYFCGQNEFAIRDPIWGDCLVKNEGLDRIWFKLLDNPLIRRSLSIEQLSLDPSLSTIPNTGYFSRWEHIWGSVVFVRRMLQDHGHDMELSDHQQLILQLRTFVSDLGHTAFSHLGDWMFQGKGNKENQHDLDLAYILEVSGINDILADFGISPEEVVFPEVVDWIEAPSPDLCVDRVDYGLREMHRWQRTLVSMWQFKYPHMFTVTSEGELIMTSEKAARMFARGFSILPTEHWGEPTHRLQLQLLEEMVKRTFTNNHAIAGEQWRPHHGNPREWMYAIDDDFLANTRTADRFMWVVRDLAENIAQQRRRIFVSSRRQGLAAYLHGSEPFPVPGHKLLGFHGHFPQYPNNVHMMAVTQPDEVDDFGGNSHAVDFFLPPLKPRMIKPRYLDGGTIKRLDEQDEDMAAIYGHQEIAMGQAYVARVFVTPEYKKIVERGLAHNQKRWPELVGLPRMNAAAFRKVIGRSALLGARRAAEVIWAR